MERYYKKQCLNPSPNIPDSPPLPSNILGSPPPPSNIPSSLPSSIPGNAQQSEVTELDDMNLPIQLDNYIHDMKMHSEFSSLRGIRDLAKELVKTGRCESYMLVYKLLTLTLVLPVATASVERAFFAMKIVKTPLRNKIGDQ
ncbi:hypothetical protein ACFX2J_019027 [Malus domestica]